MSEAVHVSDEALNQAADHLGDLLQARGWVMATAESCTGGWVAKVLTDRPGSSAYVTAGLVTYSNAAKQAVLGVDAGTLAQHGAVSEPVVRQMVAGAVALTGADVAVAISGIAGPGGGSEDKPVGTVWFAWGAGPEQTEVALRHFAGDREQVRRQSVLFALQSLAGYVQQLKTRA